jgi:predicted ATP-binding protein involved in virulence
LFGYYNHRVEFEPNWEFAIVYGLNGVGKTRFLELIHAALRMDIRVLGTANYSHFRLEMTDGQVIYAERVVVEGSARLELELHADDRLIAHWASTFEIEADERFERYLLDATSWRQLDENVWQDRSDQEVADIDELKRRYQPQSAVFPPMRQLDDDFRIFADAHPSVFIQTQRLARSIQARSFTFEPEPVVAVDSYALDLKQRLERALASNSLISQGLDRTFPARILAQSVAHALPEDEIRERYEALSTRRERLSDIGLIDKEDDLPLPSKTLESWQRAVLTTYLDDADTKLRSFDELVDKIDLLERLLNRRFLNKSIDITTKRGLTVHSLLSEQEIPMTGLSSGEQHELVLLYSLLFSVRPGAVVLIDEPEISLHVSWQKKFLDDILAVSRSSDLTFLIATHSPQIIGRWWSRTAELGPRDSFDGRPELGN